MKPDTTSQLRQAARVLIRELGLLKLNSSRTNRTTQEWHILLEVQKTPNITLTKLSQLLLLSTSRTSRIVNALIKDKLLIVSDGIDKREKYLEITTHGINEIKKIDEFSNIKIKGALAFLTEDDQQQIIAAMKKYSEALKKNRLIQEQVKIHTLSTSRIIRKQIISLIENIQKNEFSLPLIEDLNAGILKAEKEFYYNNSYNFWYATDNNGTIVGCIGLKQIDKTSGEIKKFFVVPSYRGMGIAQKLMQSAAKSALKHNFDFLYLGTVDILKAAQNFYQKHGFSLIKEDLLPSNFEKCPLDNVFYKIKGIDLRNNILNHIQG